MVGLGVRNEVYDKVFKVASLFKLFIKSVTLVKIKNKGL